MKKHLSHALLELCLCITLTAMPTVAAAAEEATIPNNCTNFVLQNGTTYHITTDTRVWDLRVANNATVTILIDKGVTLESIGYGGAKGIGGRAGIYLPEGSTLILKGSGTLTARGGRGGDGTDGSRGTGYIFQTPDANLIAYFGGITDVDYIGGTGGKGGIGAGGGGAGIGTNGGNGAHPGNTLGHGCGFDFEGGKNGFSYTTGSSGVAGSDSANAGTVYNYGVNLNATGGSGGNAGTAADDSSKHKIKDAYKVSFGVLGEWDVFETYIRDGEGGGGGQAGNSGKSIGAGGGGGGSGHNGAGGDGQCSRNFVFGIRTMSYIRTCRQPDGVAGAYGNSGNYYVYSEEIKYNNSP